MACSALGDYDLTPIYSWDDINSLEDLEVKAANAIVNHLLANLETGKIDNVGDYWGATANWLAKNGHSEVAFEIRRERRVND
jgi:hypothetical protein